MSSLAGNTNLIANAPKTAGLTASNLSTNEQGIVLRYFAGVGRFALTWLGPAYNQVAKAVQSSNGGKADTGAASSHKYYADCAGLLCVGLVDAVREIWMQSNQVWTGNVARTGGEDSATITIENYGTLTIYWGTETQPVDPLLAPHDHPAYRGQCYVVFRQLYFGQDTTSAPNVEFVVERAPKNTGLATATNLADDIVAPHAMIELLTDQRFGLGWDGADLLDLAAWDASATQTLAEGIGISPMLDQETDARELLVQFCDYFDGYIVAEPTTGGKLALRLARPFVGDPTTLPLLGEYELLDVPNPASQNWRETYNVFAIKYTDQTNQYQTNSVLYNDPANRRVVGEPLPTSMERPWITKTALAAQSGAYAARLRSVPWVTAKDIHVRKEAAAGIEPGSFVRLTYADYTETILMRVQSRKVEADRSQGVQFELRADGFFNEILAYIPDVPPRPDVPVVTPAQPVYQRLLEMPWGLVPARDDQNRPQFAALVARGSGLDVRWRVYSSDDGTTYDQDAHSRDFCIYGTLASALAVTHVLDDGADGVLIDLPGVDGVLDLETTTEPGRLKARLLVFVEDEILAYRDVVLVSPTRARLLGLRRGCYDTFVAAHAAGAAVGIIRRKNLHLWTDATYEKGQGTHLKVTTATAQAELDLGDPDVVDELVSVQSRTTRPLPPMNVRINGVGVAPTYTGVQDVLIEWDAASWRRHTFFNSWDEAYSDPKLWHKVLIVAADGTTKRKVNIAPGLGSYTYAAADLLSDFGGSVPATWTVEVAGRRRGARSLVPVQQMVTKTAQPPTNPPACTNWMYPSQMSQVLGSCDPETLTDRNFALLAAHFGLTLPPTAVQDEDGAPLAIQANFDAIAAARSVTLYPVATSRDPEVAAEANFQILNGIW